MNKTDKQIAQAAERFAKRWEGKGYEKGKSIGHTAHAILDSRALYPDSSQADLYDPVTMPPELLKTHRDNDRAVMGVYGFPTTMVESEIVAHLFNLYSELIKQ